ncbi:OB-fold-like isoform 1 [Hibiscus syriacus]|uniref:protein-serine/threonine phosphatase n=1 Tax=Hibiscus syriacus TaxID=106335 RepID=A0A6A3BFD3_HIBSY|nr:OB-fold-like isoform 1 [Hibiscus syriacus]
MDSSSSGLDWRKLFVGSNEQALEFFPPDFQDGITTVKPPSEAMSCTAAGQTFVKPKDVKIWRKKVSDNKVSSSGINQKELPELSSVLPANAFLSTDIPCNSKGDFSLGDDCIISDRMTRNELQVGFAIEASVQSLQDHSDAMDKATMQQTVNPYVNQSAATTVADMTQKEIVSNQCVSELVAEDSGLTATQEDAKSGEFPSLQDSMKKKPRGRKKDVTGSSGKAEVLVDGPRKARAASVGVVVLLNEIKAKKNDHMDKSKGINNPLKQLKVVRRLDALEVDIICLMESRIMRDNSAKFISSFSGDWNIADNYVAVEGVIGTVGGHSTAITTLYGSNNGVVRRRLWDHLRCVENDFGSSSWVIGGDFNITARAEESSDFDILGVHSTPDMRDFQECLEDLDLIDHPFLGTLFSCSNRHKGFFLARKLDMILVNPQWLLNFPESFAEFKAQGASDHCLGLLWSHKGALAKKPRPFKFFNCWTAHEEFFRVVKESWQVHCACTAMQCLFNKLRRLKPCLKDFNKVHFSDIYGRVRSKRAELEQIQVFNLSHVEQRRVEEEMSIHAALVDLEVAESEFYRQRAKIHWLKEGDLNTSGNTVESLKGLLNFSLPVEAANCLTKEVDDVEIKNALFRQGKDKSPGPDGFTSGFFKAAWDIVGADFVSAVRNIVDNTLLAQEIVKGYSRKSLSPSTLEKFYELSGLKLNAQKTEFFACGLNEHTVEQICRVTGFSDSPAKGARVGWSQICTLKSKGVLFQVSELLGGCLQATLQLDLKLSTKDRLARFGLIVDNVCGLCGIGMESRDHLFVDCSYAKDVWGSILNTCDISHVFHSWDELLHWLLANLKGNTILDSMVGWLVRLRYLEEKNLEALRCEATNSKRGSREEVAQSEIYDGRAHETTVAMLQSIVVFILVLLMLILLIIAILVFAFRPWRFFSYSYRYRTIKVGELERPLVSTDVDVALNQSNNLTRNYDLDGQCHRTEALLRSPRTQGLVHKQRLSSASPCSTLGDSVVLDVHDPLEDILVGATLKRPVGTEHLVELQKHGRPEKQSQNLRFGAENDIPQGSVPNTSSEQRSCLSLEVVSGPSDFIVLYCPRALHKLRWELMDMGSLNGTLLNSRPINHPDSRSRQWGNPVELASGDTVTVGTTSNIYVHISSQNDHLVPSRVGMTLDPMSLRRGGKKFPMEDVCYYQWPLPGIDQFGVFGICDGHGGVEAAKSASKILPEMVATILSDSVKRERVVSQQDGSDVLRDTLSQTEARMNNYYEIIIVIYLQGCTATLLLVWADADENLFAQCANVGDSACFMNVDGKQIKMTEDHKITGYSERLRIEGIGVPLKDGETWLCGMYRFLHLFFTVRIRQHHRIMASDGLWDAISFKKAIPVVVQTRGRYSTDDENLAEKIDDALLNEARNLRTKDNTSLIFLDFDSTSTVPSCKVLP